MKLLMPHLQCAARLRHGLHMLQVEATVMDVLTLGVLVIDERLDVPYANPSGRGILAKNGGIAMAGNRLTLSQPRERAELRSLSVRACDPSLGPAIRPGGVMTVVRPSGRRPYTVVVNPTNAKALKSSYGNPAAILLISDPDDQAMPSKALLARLYRLTPAEASLAGILLRGDDLNDACDEMSIRRTTARTHSQHLFQTVGVSRQAELLAVLLRAADPVRTSSR